MKSKRIVFIPLIAVLAIILIGCTAQPITGQPATGQPTTVQTTTVQTTTVQPPDSPSADQPETTEEEAPGDEIDDGFSSGASDPIDENPSFMVEDYQVFYEIVPQADYEQVFGAFKPFFDGPAADAETERVFYIRFTGAEIDGEPVNMGYSWRSALPVSRFIYTIDGTDYQQSALNAGIADDLYYTYIFVPKDTPDDVQVSIRYTG